MTNNIVQEISVILVRSFFECLRVGLISDEQYKKRFDDPGSFKNVKLFREMVLQNKIAKDDLEGNQLVLSVVETVLEELNNYLVGKPEQPEFDETTSEDYFLRITNDLKISDPFLTWIMSLWRYTFEQLSNYEKVSSFAKDLHSASLSTIGDYSQRLSDSIKTAQGDVDKLTERIYGHGTTPGLEGKISNAELKIDGFEERIEKVKEGVQTTTVTVLGIFASIILAFSGTFSFSSAVLQNMHVVSIYRLIGITALIGCVSFNIIFSLMYYLLIERNANTSSNSSRKFYFPWGVVNFVLIATMIFSYYSWKNGWLEKTIEDTYQQNSTSEIGTVADQQVNDGNQGSISAQGDNE